MSRSRVVWTERTSTAVVAPISFIAVMMEGDTAASRYTINRIKYVLRFQALSETACMPPHTTSNTTSRTAQNSCIKHLNCVADECRLSKQAHKQDDCRQRS